MQSMKHNRLVIIGLLSVIALIPLRYFVVQDQDPYQAIVEIPAPPPIAVVGPVPFKLDVDLERELQTRTAATVTQIGQELADLLAQEEFGLLRDRLMNEAAEAVAAGDKSRLGHVLSLMGQVAIEEQDLDSAEVFLMEALDVYELLGDTVGAAQVYMQLGRTHLKSRELARSAGDAYDRLLVARWQLSENEYAAAEQNLKHVIDASLTTNRFGAAASAHYSLARLYAENNDTFRAEQAAMEAARLYASSGQIRRASATVKHLELAGIEGWRLYDIELEIKRSYAEFQDSVQQIERARDYRQLYNHYRSQDQERAWKLRLLASKSLKNVSKRAMYHRQPDALALLYVSNTDMERAEVYFDIAKETFDSEGLDGLSSQTQKLKAQIF